MPKLMVHPQNPGQSKGFEDLYVTDYTINFGQTWKDVMFLPFYRLFNYFFIIFVYMSIMLSIFVLTYHPTGAFYNHFIININSALEAVYLIRTILVLVHRFNKHHRQRKIYPPEPMPLLALDILTLLPVASYCNLHNRYNWYDPIDHRIGDFYVYILKLPRLVRLLYLYVNVTADLALHPATVTIITHWLVSCMLVLTMSSIFYLIFYYSKAYSSWANAYDDMNRDYVSIHTPLICFLFAGGFYFKDLLYSINQLTMYEMLTAGIAILLGFTLHNAFLGSHLIAIYVQLMKLKHYYEWKLLYLAKLTSVIQFEEGLQNSITTYYRTIWRTRNALVDKPELVNLFPLQLRSEITLDLYFDAIRHTMIFRHMNVDLNKELSRLFQTEIYIPGQLLYQKDKIKSKLVYIHSGIVEVMSTENRDSPVLSFSPGTVLGELSCLRPYNCNADIRCATTCIMHVVRHRQVSSLMRRDVSLEVEVGRTMKARFAYAMQKQQKCKKLETPMSHIYWIKYRWKQLLQLSDNKQLMITNNMTKYFSSRYLNLLVLSSFDELKVHSICIRGKCSFVMEKNSSFRRFLEGTCLIFVILHFLLTFHKIFFIGKIEPDMFALLTLFDLTYFLDIYLQAITAVKTANIFISKPMDILLYKCKSFKFLLDAFASVPYDYFAMVMGATSYYVGLCRVPKFIKLYKVLEYFIHLETTSVLSIKTITVMTFVCKHVVIIAVCACLAYLLTCYNNECRATGWFETYHRRIREEFNVNLTVDAYTMSLIYTSSVYLKLLVHLERPENDWEMLVQFCMGVCGFYLLNQTKVYLSGSIALENYPRFLYMCTLSSLNSMIHEHPEMKEFKTQMNEFISLQWCYSNSIYLSEIPAMMNNNSKFVRYKIRHEFIIFHFKKTKLFGGLSERFLNLLTRYANFYVVPAGHCLQRPDTACSFLYIILDGYCNVVSHIADDALRAQSNPIQYSKYDVFPIVGFFQQVDSFIHVETYTSCKVFALSYHEYKSTTMALPHDAHLLTATIKGHLKEHKNVIRRILHLPLLNYPYTPTLHEPVDKFDYAEEKREAASNFKHISQWRKRTKNLLQRQVYWVLTSTYDPNGRAFIYYEIFRNSWILADVIFMYFSFYRHVRFSRLNVTVQSISKFLCVIDFFIRAHVQYYNQQGIRVTNSRSTLFYYLKRSFIIDVISNLPYDSMRLFEIFKGRKQSSINIMFILITKPLSLYRPYTFGVIVRKTIALKYYSILMSISNCVLFFYVIFHLTIVTLLLSCSLNDDWYWECPNDAWIRFLPNFQFWSESQYLINRTFFEVISLSRQRAAKYFTYPNFLIFFIAAIIMYMGYLLVMCIMIGYNVFNMKYLVNFHENRRLYNKFASKFQFPKLLKDELIEHYKFKFKKTQTDSTVDIMNTFYPYLREQIQLAMFVPTLRASQIFIGVSPSCFNSIVPFITENYYKMNGQIICCNDIISEIYIVKKGVIEIFIAGCTKAVLGVGGAFGCFASKGTSRMTITAVAKMHSNCLIINTKTFYDLLQIYPTIKRDMELVNYTNAEYILGYYEYHAIDEQRRVNICTFRNWYNYSFDNKGASIIFYRYFTNMHFAPIVSIAAMLCMVMMSGQENLEAYWAAADVYFLIDMYMSCHIQYTDNDSGLCLTNVKTLTRKYLKSSKFYLDVVTILPLYAIKGRVDYTHDGIFLINKSFRIFNMFFYYMDSVRTRFQSNHMRFTFLIYMNFFCIEAMFFIFYFAPRLTFLDVEVTVRQIASGHMQVVNMLAEVGLSQEPLQSLWHLMSRQAMVICTFLLYVWMSCGFAKLAVMIFYSRLEFRRAVITFKTYCYNEHVSKPIVDQCWNYLMHLYTIHGGVQFPTLITNAPNYIIEAHMLFIAKNIICNHPLFKNAHYDFIRQLMRHLKYEFIMPGFTIIESGDTKMRLYFVQSGKVLAIIRRGDENFYEILGTGQSFGEMQAIRRYKFRKTYKALTPCQLIWIKTKDYAYLLNWFPATTQTLMNAAQVYIDEEY